MSSLLTCINGTSSSSLLTWSGVARPNRVTYLRSSTPTMPFTGRPDECPAPPPDPDAASPFAPEAGDPAGNLSVAELCRRCRQETVRYRGGEPHDDRYSFEVFRRAVVERDERCWQELYDLYHDQVLTWCRQAGGALAGDLDEFLALTWERFWMNYTPEKLHASTGTAAMLSYLKMCSRSVVVDAARGRQRSVFGHPAALPLDHAAVEWAARQASPDETLASSAGRDALWQAINSRLRDERERVLMYLTLELGLRSAEIQTRRPDLFPAVVDVYRATRNVLDRLRRDAELRAWLR
jgi:hypothetical protein